jgi:ADP-ribose pyrophosphatase
VSNRIVYQNSRYAVYEEDGEGLYLHQFQPDYATLVVLHEGELVVVKQTRAAVGGETCELPGGSLEAGEDAEQGARRELLEETGLVCGELVPMGDTFSYACMMNRKNYLFFTSDIRSTQSQELDLDEDICIERYSVDEAFARIADGRWNDPELAHALLLARLQGHL